MAKYLTFTLFLLICLSACVTIRDDPYHQKKKIDLFSIKQKADDAYQAGDYNSAENYYREYLSKTKKAPDIWFRLGNILSRTNRSEAALNAYKESVKHDPEYYKSWYNMAMIYLKLSAQAFHKAQTTLIVGTPLQEEIVKNLDTIKTITAPKAKH